MHWDNFLAKFTKSSRVLVPWLLLAKDPKEYINSDCYPEGLLIWDPSKLTKINVGKLWCHWDERQKKKVILQFIKDKAEDMPDTTKDKPRCHWHKRIYVNVDSSSDNSSDNDKSNKESDHSLSRPANSPFHTPGSASSWPLCLKPRPAKQARKGEPSSPAAEGGDQPTFLCDLCQDPCYVVLMEKTFRLLIQVDIIF